MSWFLLLLVIGGIFTAYAYWTYYHAQPADNTKFQKIIGAMVMAGAAIGAWVMSFFTTP